MEPSRAATVHLGADVMLAFEPADSDVSVALQRAFFADIALPLFRLGAGELTER